ncbi:RES family NAD+ phosphorylase [Variovorax ginsengisoli]|uniref:RES family NAD+ phosphorylase n=1 Tax=Variovorax ginsengisoli TaxID=363844 RepID=A0ABT8SBX0_9BURK|nr:RES family NAD+ phosphorylase [Variovorax ginsengisoli]MDN8617243.1 RES family NAD+ phosphorylase [Variovorax ginsengisoli]MDO1536413.1 RES family NAD+ phosphorylase [Variovorax ginsengisoli]
MSNICMSCLKDPFLRQQLAGKVDAGVPCEYCEQGNPAAPLFEVAWECDRVIDAHFEPTHEAMAVVIYDRTPAGADLEETLRRLDVVPEGALGELKECVESLWFDRDSTEWKYGDDEDPWFDRKRDMSAPVSRAWNAMEESLLEEARHLNPKAQGVLDEVLGELTWDRTEDGKHVVAEAGPGSPVVRLFRARVFQSDDELQEALSRPEDLLGTPAPGIGKANRMNARGQPAFYGATHPQIAIAEVRPPVGSKVAVAAFDIVRPLRLLDLRSLARIQLDSTLSLFDPRSIDRAQRRDFLRVLSQLMVVPVMPDHEHRGYVITQVIADYLATHPRAAVDGIVYPSVQAKDPSGASFGDNVVLFPRASRVRPASPGSTASAYLWEHEEDGPGRRFEPQIWFNDAPKEQTSRPSFPTGTPADALATRRPVALELVRDQIEIHEILDVAVATYPERVRVRVPEGRR